MWQLLPHPYIVKGAKTDSQLEGCWRRPSVIAGGLAGDSQGADDSAIVVEVSDYATVSGAAELAAATRRHAAPVRLHPALPHVPLPRI